MSDLPILHVVFGLSAAGSLRQAMSVSGRPDKVVGFPDDLSFGPIDLPDTLHRAQWVESERDYEWSSPEAEWTEQIGDFWAQAIAKEYRLTAWTSIRCAAEYCGYLEWLRRVGEREVEVVDLAHYQIPEYVLRDGPIAPTQLAVSAGRVPAQQIIDAKLYDRATPQSSTARIVSTALGSPSG